MMRALLDIMIFDEIVANKYLKADVLKLIGTGELVIDARTGRSARTDS
jgi:hypothetical protein